MKLLCYDSKGQKKPDPQALALSVWACGRHAT